MQLFFQFYTLTAGHKLCPTLKSSLFMFCGEYWTRMGFVFCFLEQCCISRLLFHVYTLCFSVCKVEPRGLIARRVTEVAQSTLNMVSTAVDYPLCKRSCFLPSHIEFLLCSSVLVIFRSDSF